MMKIFAILAVIVASWYSIQQPDRGICRIDHNASFTQLLNFFTDFKVPTADFPFECFFHGNYFEARSEFRSATTLASADLHTFHITNGLTTDVAVIRSARKSDRVLIHVSGTHGAEAFHGSAIQIAFLHMLSRASPSERERLPTIILIHALNPYGYANLRRFNENNVDLNRNFLSPSQWKIALSRDPNIANYEDLRWALNPPHYSSHLVNDVLFYAKFLVGVAFHGMLGLKRAMVAGNYHDSNGIYFGGRETQPSISQLYSFLSPKLSQFKSVVFLDVHSGLGPSSFDTVQFTGTMNDDQFEVVFPEEEGYGGLKTTNPNSVGAVAMSGYELTIGTSQDLCDWYFSSIPSRLCMTQEFGTVSPSLVGKATVQEAAVYRQSKGVVFEDEYSQGVKDVFYVETREWKRRVTRRGLLVMGQALINLMK